MFSHVACWGTHEFDGGREADFLGRKGEKCFVSKRGPMVFTAKVLVSWEWSN